MAWGFVGCSCATIYSMHLKWCTDLFYVRSALLSEGRRLCVFHRDRRTTVQQITSMKWAHVTCCWWFAALWPCGCSEQCTTVFTLRWHKLRTQLETFWPFMHQVITTVAHVRITMYAISKINVLRPRAITVWFVPSNYTSQNFKRIKTFHNSCLKTNTQNSSNVD